MEGKGKFFFFLKKEDHSRSRTHSSLNRIKGDKVSDIFGWLCESVHHYTTTAFASLGVYILYRYISFVSENFQGAKVNSKPEPSSYRQADVPGLRVVFSSTSTISLRA